MAREAPDPDLGSLQILQDPTEMPNFSETLRIRGNSFCVLFVRTMGKVDPRYIHAGQDQFSSSSGLRLEGPIVAIIFAFLIMMFFLAAAWKIILAAGKLRIARGKSSREL